MDGLSIATISKCVNDVNDTDNDPTDEDRPNRKWSNRR
jgi:hypothetical protein